MGIKENNAAGLHHLPEHVELSKLIPISHNSCKIDAFFTRGGGPLSFENHDMPYKLKSISISCSSIVHAAGS